MRGLAQFLKTTIAGGFFVILPVVLVFLVIVELDAIVTELIQPVVEAERRSLEQRKLDSQLESWLGARRTELLASQELFVNLEAIGRR